MLLRGFVGIRVPTRRGCRTLKADPAAHEQQRNQVWFLTFEIPEEVEVGSVGRLQYTLQEQRAVAALVGRLGRLKGCLAPCELVGPMSMSRRFSRTSSTIGSPVRTSPMGPPTADSGATWTTRVPNEVPLMRESEMRTMSSTPSRSSFGWDGHACRIREIPVRRSGRRSRRIITLSLVMSRSGSSTRAAEVVDVLEHERRPAVPQEVRRRGAALDHCAPRGQRTAQDDVRAPWLQR